MYFVCHTAYHTYISSIKCMTEGLHCSILLTDNIPNVDHIAAQIQKEGIFQDVKVLKHADILPAFSKGSFHITYLLMKLFPHKAEKQLSFLLNDDELYLYNDYSNIGAFLMQHSKPYSLIEDGCNTFTRDAHHLSGKAQIVKNFLFETFKIPYAIGMTTLCREIEVNDADALKTQFPFPAKSVNRKEMNSRLTPAQQDTLTRIFLVDLKLDPNKKNMLVLTDPEREGYNKRFAEKQARMYDAKLQDYADEYEVYIKAHPRDQTKYESVLNGRVHIIDKTVPVEVLNLNKNLQFDLGLVREGSTAMFTVECCKEMRSLQLD